MQKDETVFNENSKLKVLQLSFYRYFTFQMIPNVLSCKDNLLKGHGGVGSRGRDGGKVGHRPQAVAGVGVQLSLIS